MWWSFLAYGYVMWSNVTKNLHRAPEIRLQTFGINFNISNNLEAELVQSAKNILACICNKSNWVIYVIRNEFNNFSGNRKSFVWYFPFAKNAKAYYT